MWYSYNDTLSLSIEKLVQNTENLLNITKRSALSTASKIFDPLGFAEPFIVQAKIMIQALWKLKIGWDNILPKDENVKWLKWMNDITNLKSLIIPRPYSSNNMTETQLHIFCDSSKLAHGAVAFLRGRSENMIKTTFVLAKSKVAPVKMQTLPRLELSAALLGANISPYLKNIPEFLNNNCKITLWSDSQIVLSWLSSKKKLQPYIQNRINKINELTSSHKWKFCPTSGNPADLLTRGLTTKQFNDNKQFWFHGPYWLAKPEQGWPEKLLLSECEINETIINTVNIQTNNTSTLNIIDLERYSTWKKALRVTALVIKFTKTWLNKLSYTPLTANDVYTAKNTLIKAIQQKHYSTEFAYLSGNTATKLPPMIQQLQLFIDEHGLIRCRGRLHHAKLANNTKFPILIPKNSYLTTLIVKATHLIVMHGGVRDILTQIRQNYWIPKGRQLVKQTISKCVVCRKVEGPPFRSVTTPPLPEQRLTGSQPFQITGIDYAGPLYIRNTTKEPTKVYICLFTCAAIRAVHLEVVEDQTSVTFLKAFRRFVSRRGVPETLISDNAKTFKAGYEKLKSLTTQILAAANSQQFLTNHGIKWNFIAERAPWWGGFYERMIGLVKRRLKKMIRKASLNLIELQTIITEIEAVLNSRPLTFTYSDINDGPPLTPSHFLCGYRLLTLPDPESQVDRDPEYQPHGTSTKDLSKRAQYHQKLMQKFWKQWREEYLTNLREQHSAQKRKTLSGASISEGKVVIIHDDIPRNRWKMGVITKLLPGKDGLVRAVTLRTCNGKSISRPIEKLYPLEMSEVQEEIKEDKNEAANEDNEISDKPPTRIAAKRAAQRIKELYD